MAVILAKVEFTRAAVSAWSPRAALGVSMEGPGIRPCSHLNCGRSRSILWASCGAASVALVEVHLPWQLRGQRCARLRVSGVTFAAAPRSLPQARSPDLPELDSSVRSTPVPARHEANPSVALAAGVPW